MFVRHSAWLNTVPDKAEHDKSKAPGVSRLQTMKDEKKDDLFEPDMPPVSSAQYLVGYLYEMGPTMAAGMGSGPISQTEIRNWMDNMGVDLTPWEVTCIRRLSNDYASESHKAAKRNCPAPWAASDAGISLKAVDTRNALRDLARL